MTEINDTSSISAWEKIKSFFSDSKYEKISQDLLRRVAFELSREFKHSELVACLNETGGYDIKPWIRDNYQEYYYGLLDKDVIGLGILYSRKYFSPDIIKRLDKIPIEDCHITKVKCKQSDIRFENEPRLPFSSAYVISRRPLDEELFYIIGEPYEIYEYDVPADVAYVHWGLLGWARHDRPILLVLHAFGKDEILFGSIEDAKKIDKELKSLMVKVINDLMAKQNTADAKIDGALRVADEWKEILDHSIKKIRTERHDSVQNDLKRLKKERKEKEENDLYDKLPAIIVACIIIALIGFIVFMFFNSFFGSTQENTITEGVMVLQQLIQIFRMRLMF